MSDRKSSIEVALADRLVNYADALVAVSFLSVSGIGLAVADADTRCTVASAAGYVVVGNLTNGVIFTALILLMRRWELDLRKDEPPGAVAARYMHWLHRARFVIVWTSILAAIALAWQSRDEACEFEAAAWRMESGVGIPAQVPLVAESIRPERSPVA